MVFCSLLREIQKFRGRRCWPQGTSQLYPDGARNCSLFWESLSKLNFRSAQSSDTVNTALCMNGISKTQRTNSAEPAPPLVSDKPRCPCGKGKKTLTPIPSTSAGEKTQQKAQNTQNTWTTWNSPRKQTPRRKKECPMKTLFPGEKNGLVRLSRQRVFSARCEDGESLMTAIYRQPPRAPLSANSPWDSISELVSEKWLFHGPQNTFTPQRPAFPRRSRIEAKWLKAANDTDKE